MEKQKKARTSHPHAANPRRRESGSSPQAAADPDQGGDALSPGEGGADDQADGDTGEEIAQGEDMDTLVDADDVIDIGEVDETLPARLEAAGTSVVRLEPLQQYLSEIRRYRLLKRDEEMDLATRYVETNDPQYAHALVTANLRLVVKIALDYRRYWMNLLDLIQEGNVGLMQAVRKFDPYKNVKLSSYASFWIKAYILKFIMDNWSLVRIGSTQAQRKLFFNLRKERERLAKMGVTPDAANIAESLDLDENDVVEMSQRMAGNDLSLDAPVGEDGEESHVDFLSDQDAVPVDEALAENEIQELFSRNLVKFRETLSDKDLFLFDNRLITEDPKTLQEIGDYYGVTRERVRQIESRLMRKLKQFMLEQIPELKDFDIAPPGD